LKKYVADIPEQMLAFSKKLSLVLRSVPPCVCPELVGGKASKLVVFLAAESYDWGENRNDMPGEGYGQNH
jgi:hypothetical protein